MFPYGQQRQIRLQLSQVIEGILSQSLIPKIGGGRIAAVEVMLATTVIRRLIRDEKIFDIGANIEMSKLEGMQTLDQASTELVRNDYITQEDAMIKSSNPRRLAELLSSPNNSSGFQPSSVRGL